MDEDQLEASEKVRSRASTTGGTMLCPAPTSEDSDGDRRRRIGGGSRPLPTEAPKLGERPENNASQLAGKGEDDNLDWRAEFLRMRGGIEGVSAWRWVSPRESPLRTDDRWENI
jgi:hypothetical protein